MAAHMVDQVRSVQPCGPYQLSGYCFGGVVAYEIARQLAGAGETISFLGLFDATAPPNLPRWIRRIRAHREVMRAQSPAEQWKYFLRRISSIGRRLLGIQKRPVSVEADSVSSGIESADAVMAASIRALESYIPVASGGSAILFQSVRDSGRMQRQARSWSGLLNGGLQTDVIPGMHHDIFRAENVNTLAGKLTPLLQAGPGGT
jgi:thioesterase domain-containing protein